MTKRKYKRKITRGSAIRKSYTLDFKIKILKLLDEAESQKDIKHKTDCVAKKNGVLKSLAVKWKSNKAELLKQLSDNARNRSTSTTPSIHLRRKINSGKRSRHVWFPLAENNVMIDYKRKRSLGGRITKLWLKTKMRIAIRGIYGDAAANKFKASQNWFLRFCKRQDITLRRRTNKRSQGLQEKIKVFQKFHTNLRKAVKSKRRRNPSYGPIWGHWLPANRWNVDQVPLPFVNDQETTYADKGSSSVWIAQPGSGLDKRQSTLQLCIRPEGDQTVKPAIVFRGTGLRIEEDERQTIVMMFTSRKKYGWIKM